MWFVTSGELDNTAVSVPSTGSANALQVKHIQGRTTVSSAHKFARGCAWGAPYISHQHCPIIRRVNAPHHESHDLNRLSTLANALLYSRMCMHELRSPGKTRKGRVMHSMNTQHSAGTYHLHRCPARHAHPTKVLRAGSATHTHTHAVVSI